MRSHSFGRRPKVGQLCRHARHQLQGTWHLQRSMHLTIQEKAQLRLRWRGTEPASATARSPTESVQLSQKRACRGPVFFLPGSSCSKKVSAVRAEPSAPCASQRLYIARSAADSATGTRCTVFSGSSTTRRPSTTVSLVRRSASALSSTCARARARRAWRPARLTGRASLPGGLLERGGRRLAHRSAGHQSAAQRSGPAQQALGVKDPSSLSKLPVSL